MATKFGTHRDNRSGRGLPNKFFMPLVTNQVEATDKPRPSQPTCSSHSFRVHTRRLGVPSGTVGPGTKTRDTKRMTTMGTTTAITSSNQSGTVSRTVKGNLGSKIRLAGFFQSNRGGKDARDVAIAEGERPLVGRYSAQDTSHDCKHYHHQPIQKV